MSTGALQQRSVERNITKPNSGDTDKNEHCYRCSKINSKTKQFALPSSSTSYIYFL